MINTKPLIKILLWILTLFLICIIGLTNVFADETNIGYISNDTQVLVSLPNQGAPITLNQNSHLNNSNANAFWFNISHSFTKDILYQLEIYTPSAKFTNVNTFGIQYNGGVCNFYGYSDANLGFPKIYFKCPVNVNYISISIKNWDDSSILTGSDFYWNYTYLRSYTDDEEIDLGPVISNQNQNTQDIINNQNQNTQDIINSSKVCNTINKSYIYQDNKFLTSSGSVAASSYFGLTDYININNSTIEVLQTQTNSDVYYCFYDIDKTKIQCSANNTLSGTLTLPNDAYYVRFSLHKSTDKPQLKICKNGNEALNDSVNSLDNTLKDDNVDDNNIASSFEDFNDFLDDNSTITQLITLPITLYTAILNNLNGSCSPFNLGSLYGENLVLPCINVSQYLGSTLWNMIDIIISGFAIFAISKKMIKVFNNFSSLREGDVIDD